MAMTAQVKAELANIPVTKTCCRKAEVSTTLRFAGGLHIVNGRIVVEAELDTGAAARRPSRERPFRRCDDRYFGLRSCLHRRPGC